MGYFQSGKTAGPFRNGAPCRSSLPNDPLEGFRLQIRLRQSEQKTDAASDDLPRDERKAKPGKKKAVSDKAKDNTLHEQLQLEEDGAEFDVALNNADDSAAAGKASSPEMPDAGTNEAEKSVKTRDASKGALRRS
jgi:hypothetical protein